MEDALSLNLVVESPVEVDGWGSALVTSEMWHESNGCSTLTAAYVAVLVAALFMNWFTLWRARFSWSAQRCGYFQTRKRRQSKFGAMRISFVRPSSKLFGRCCTVWGLTSERPWTVSLDGLQDAALTWAARRATLLGVDCHPCGPRCGDLNAIRGEESQMTSITASLMYVGHCFDWAMNISRATLTPWG